MTRNLWLMHVGAAGLILLAACGAPAALGGGNPARVTPEQGGAGLSAASSSDNARSGDHLLILDGGGITLLDAGSGALIRSLPMGVFSPDGARLYSAAFDGMVTAVRATDWGTGARLAETKVPGHFQFPPVDADPVTALGGIDPSGRWLGMEEHVVRGGVSWTRLALLSAGLKTGPRLLEIRGDFTIDALSPDGRSVYLLEYANRNSGAYRVRRLDAPSGVLDPNPVVDKRNPDEAMVGYRATAVASPDGAWLYSLYVNPTSTGFIHALNLTDGTAVCIDLPPAPVHDEESELDWSIAITPDGKSLYAVNTLYWMAAEIDLAELRVVRSTVLRAAVEPGIWHRLADWFAPPAEAKMEGNGTAIVSADGQMIFAGGGGVLLAVRAKDLSLAGAWLPGTNLMSLALSPDGQRIYAVSNGSTLRVLEIDPATGHLLRWVEGAREPRSILRVILAGK